MIPDSTMVSLEMYAQDGYQPGSFLTAVLSNDLFGAVAHGDNENLVALPELVRYIFNNLPSGIVGSKERVRLWIEKKSQERK